MLIWVPGSTAWSWICSVAPVEGSAGFVASSAVRFAMRSYVEFTSSKKTFCAWWPGVVILRGEASARSSGRFTKGVRIKATEKEAGDSLPFEEDIDAVPAERTAVLK